MTFRALLIGTALGLVVSAFTFFNDAVIRQSWFISNHLPISVFGAVVLLLLGVNPLLGRLGRRLPLSVAEVAVIAAIGLASCGWPSFGFHWGFAANTGTPIHWLRSEPAWQANHVMSYVPGATSELGAGHVREPDALIRQLVAAGGEATDDRDDIAAQVWRHLTPRQRQELVAAADDPTDPRRTQRLVMLLNQVIREAPLHAPPGVDASDWPTQVAALLDRPPDQPLHPTRRAALNRWLLVEAFPGILPPPEGDHLLVAGRPGVDDAINALTQGRPSRGRSIFETVSWGVWWPTVRLWGGLALLLGIASLCLALVVHPQWSRRELLAYPLAQFVTVLSRRDDGRLLPTVARQGLFWLGLGAAATIHLVNGLHAWFPSLPHIPLLLEFQNLTELFPNASRVDGSTVIFNPYLYLSAIAFAFFLSTQVSFSVGIASIAFLGVGGAVLAAGAPLTHDYLGATPISLMRFGSYLAMTGTIVYVGRRYYAQWLGGMIGLSAAPEVPRYALWAGRAMIPCCVGAVLALRAAGLDPVTGSLFVLLVMLMFLILSRIVAETGLFFVQTWWMPVAVLTALFGIEGVGPTTYIVLALASTIIVGDPRTALMPYLTNGLEMVERSGARAVGRASWPMAAMILVGFAISGAMALALLNQRGVTVLGNWSSRTLPAMPFDALTLHLADMNARGTLVAATVHDGLTHWSSLSVQSSAMLWIGLGVALILLTALARLRLAWWPIHPVLFLIWGTMPASRLAISFLIGWAIKLAVVRTGGAWAYRRVLPLMVGVIAGELLIAAVWIIVGVWYHQRTGLSPPLYRIYP